MGDRDSDCLQGMFTSLARTTHPFGRDEPTVFALEVKSPEESKATVQLFSALLDGPEKAGATWERSTELTLGSG